MNNGWIDDLIKDVNNGNADMKSLYSKYVTDDLEYSIFKSFRLYDLLI